MITKNDIGLNTGIKGGGHSVAIVGALPKFWKVKNSWEAQFGNSGEFSITKDAIPSMTFIDIYFIVADLTQKDLAAYHRLMLVRQTLRKMQVLN